MVANRACDSSSALVERLQSHTQPLASLTSSLIGCLQAFAKSLQPAGGGGAVDDAMIEGQAEGHRLSGDELAVSHNSFFNDAADAEDRGLRQVEDRRERVDAEHSQIRDGERSIRELILAQPVRASGGDQLSSAIRNFVQVQAVCVANDRSQ